MSLALLQELLMALRANDADGYKSWLDIVIEVLGRDVAGEVESDWIVPLSVEEEMDRLIDWQLVSEEHSVAGFGFVLLHRR